MPTRKRKGDDGYHDEPPREPHKEDEGAVKIHEAYLRHRLGGGEPATPEAYRRAIEQFEKLPGAMRSTPEKIRPEEPDKKPEDENPEEEGNERGSK